MREKILILLLSALCVGQTFSAENERRWFVDGNLVYEQGSALSSEYLQQHAPDFPSKLKDVLPWVVRIEIRHSFIRNGYQSNHGTGIILKGGKVYTAGHVLTENVPAGKTQIVLTLPDGRIFTALPEKLGKGDDWARLQMVVEKGQEALLKSPIVMVDAKPGETAVFLGYPARLGLNEQGQVQSFNKGDKARGIPADKLKPMLVVASAEDLKVMTLNPLAGFPPVGGMSGGPIINLRGEFVAIQHSISKNTYAPSGKVLNYGIMATPISVTKQP